MESFCLGGAEFEIRVRNANAGITEAVENMHLAFAQGLGPERKIQESLANREHYIHVAGPELLGGGWSWKYLSALSSLLKAGLCPSCAWLSASTWHIVGAQ